MSEPAIFLQARHLFQVAVGTVLLPLFCLNAKLIDQYGKLLDLVDVKVGFGRLLAKDTEERLAVGA